MPGIKRSTHTEESAEVEVLLANTDKLKGLTKKIQASLGRLETSGKSVQEAIRPINGNTGKLQITSTNIENINKAIENIRQPLDRRRKEEDVIKLGLSRVDLADYLASMDRTNQTLTSLKNTNLRSNQEAIAELTYLLKFGGQELENAFRDLLTQESATLQTTLQYLTKQLPFPKLSDGCSSKLRSINNYTFHASTALLARSPADQQDAKTALIYAEVRGQYMESSTEGLALASINTSRKQDPNANYRAGSSGIGAYATALEQIFAAEYENIYPVFEREQWMRIHTMSCQGPLNELRRVLGELHKHIKAHIVTDCFLAYEVVDIVSSLAFRLEQKNSELKQPVQESLRPVRETAKYSLQRLLEEGRSTVQAIMAIPPDCVTMRPTYDIMARLQLMTVYIKPLGSILSSVGEGGWRSSASGTKTSAAQIRMDVGSDGRELFTSYTSDTIEMLLTSLEGKAKALIKNHNAQSMFMANNIAVVERLVNTSELGNLLSSNGRSKLEQWRERVYKQATEVWRSICFNLRDTQYTSRASNPGNRPPSGSNPNHVDSAAFVRNLAGKERDAIKEKFKTFNAAFDEQVAKYKNYKLEPEVKSRMARETAAIVDPLYVRFWDRYHEIDKGRGKYVKYDKSQLQSVIASLA